MHTDSSAKRTCNALASAVECTATVAMPSSRQARMTRRAISPRLAISTFLNTMSCLRGALRRPRMSNGLDAEQRLAELDRLTILHEDLRHATRHVGLDLVHQFHGFDDAEHLALLHHRAHLHEGRLVRGGRPVERPHERTGDAVTRLFRR